MHNRRNNRRNGYNVRKRGIKDEFIDKQILAIHRAIVMKVLNDPSLITQVEKVLEERRALGKLSYSAYLTWQCILETVDDKKLFAESVLEESPKMQRLRRKTPFIGILTEEERQSALLDEAAGTVQHLDFMF